MIYLAHISSKKLRVGSHHSGGAVKQGSGEGWVELGFEGRVEGGRGDDKGVFQGSACLVQSKPQDPWSWHFRFLFLLSFLLHLHSFAQ